MKMRYTQILVAMSTVGVLATQPLHAQTTGSRRPIVSAGSLQSSSRIADPGEHYLTVYRLCREAEVHAQQLNFTSAVNKSKEAEKILARISRDYPDWKPNMVAARRRILAENLATYAKKISSSRIPTGRQPGNAVNMDVVREIPNLPTPPSEPQHSAQRAELEKMKATNLALHRELQRAQTECRNMAEAYRDLNTRMTQMKEQLETAINERDQYRSRYETLRDQVNAERAAGNAVVESLTNQLTEMEQRYREAEQARQAAETRADELESQLVKTKAELEQVTRERDALKAENEQLRAIVEMNNPEKITQLLDQNSTLAAQLEQAQARVAELESQIAGSSDQSDVLQSQLEAARAEAARLRDEMGGIYDENMGYRRRISELSQRLNDLEADLSSHEGQPLADPALAEENRILRDIIEKQRRTLQLQEESRKLVVETYSQLKEQSPSMIAALEKLETESTLGLTDADRRVLEAVQQGGGADADGKAAARRSLELQTLADMADKAFSKCRYTAAEQLYRTLNEHQPDHVSGLVNLGTILLYRHKFEESLQYFDRAMRLAPELAISYYLSGIACYRMDRMEEARQFFSRTIELDPANGEAFFYLANIEGINGEMGKALTHYAAAVKLDSTLGDAYYNMARLYAEQDLIPDAARAYDLAVRNGAEPDVDFDKYLREHPDNAKAPGEDLVATVDPEAEARELLSQDPDMQAIISANREPAPAPAPAETPATEEKPAEQQPAEGTDTPTESEQAEQPQPQQPALPPHEQLMHDIQQLQTVRDKTPRTLAPLPGTAEGGKPATRFSTKTIRVRENGKSTRVKLRMKRSEPTLIRQRDGSLKALTSTAEEKKEKVEEKKKPTTRKRSSSRRRRR